MTTPIPFAFLFAAALLATPALAQGFEVTPESDWREAARIDGVTLWYDADKTMNVYGETRVIARWERVQPARAPDPDGGGAYTALAETLSLTCADGEWTSVERVYRDTAGAVAAESIRPDGPHPFAARQGLSDLAGMVC